MVEVEATRKDDAATIAEFFFRNVISCYGCPLELVSDRGSYFLNHLIEVLTEYFQIRHRKTTPYNLKANGLTKKSNGLLCKIFNKVTVNYAYDWDAKLSAALWAYRTAEKITTRRTPYYLTYGINPILPVEFEVPTHRVLSADRLSVEESQEVRFLQLIQLEENRDEARDFTLDIQERRKKNHDNKIRKIDLKDGDLVLLYDSRHFKFPGGGNKFAKIPFRKGITKTIFRMGRVPSTLARTKPWKANEQKKIQEIVAARSSIPKAAGLAQFLSLEVVNDCRNM
nr:uncharacterized protein LOC112276995 [Physcomitrium patens]|eukprot:XP_024364661.1 uncharacterized protein LOC112276995 [Physcomitrella patens]